MVLAGIMTDPDGISQLDQEITRIEEIINSPGFRKKRVIEDSDNGNPDLIARRRLRPRNAATIVLLDRRDAKSGNVRILMGKRHHSLAFMPGALVFPGGAVDRSDGSVPTKEELPAATTDKITNHMRGKPSKRAAHGLGVAAIREVAEETGLLIGRPGTQKIGMPGWQDFDDKQIIPSLGGISLLARAITPPGPPRRFDTWFFVLDSDAIGYTPMSGFDPSGELEHLEWLTPEDAIGGATREITRVIIVELMNRLKRDPKLDPEYSVPHYYTSRNRFMRKIM